MKHVPISSLRISTGPVCPLSGFVGPALGCRPMEMSRAESARCYWRADIVARPAIKDAPHSVVRNPYERIVRCDSVIVLVGSETEDNFEDTTEVTASSPLF